MMSLRIPHRLPVPLKTISIDGWAMLGGVSLVIGLIVCLVRHLA